MPGDERDLADALLAICFPADCGVKRDGFRHVCHIVDRVDSLHLVKRCPAIHDDGPELARPWAERVCIPVEVWGVPLHEVCRDAMIFASRGLDRAASKKLLNWTSMTKITT